MEGEGGVKWGLTPRERRQFDEAGFLVREGVLSRTELSALTRVADRLYRRYGGDAHTGRLEVRNAVAHDRLLLQMADHRTLLPAIVDLLGPDIKLRTSELDIRPPVSATAGAEIGRHRWGEPEQWHIDGPIYGYPDVDGLLPMMEVRAGYYLTDLRSPDSGCLCLAKGSHRFDYRLLADPDFRVPASAVVRIEVPPGSAILFRTGVWHCATPNLSPRTRKVLYYAYTYRWIQSSDYFSQTAALLRRCTPIQRQLIGGVVRRTRLPLGDAPLRPSSFYWFTRPEDIPLLGWWDKLASQRKRRRR
jgi:ectoine hydroxylase-related dioxygenase (phytanoyl-CoA dioxygenase family)